MPLADLIKPNHRERASLAHAGQPLNALLTAAMISSIVIVPSPFWSPARQGATDEFSRSTFTIVISSSTVTCLLPSQSPTHAGALVGVGDGTTVSPGDGVKVAGTRVSVNDAVGTGVAVSVGECDGASVGT